MTTTTMSKLAIEPHELRIITPGEPGDDRVTCLSEDHLWDVLRTNARLKDVYKRSVFITLGWDRDEMLEKVRVGPDDEHNMKATLIQARDSIERCLLD
jgi:hypothetical protein